MQFQDVRLGDIVINSDEPFDRDLGPTALEKIFQGLMIDRQWAKRSERGFEWIGYRLRQVAFASRPFQDEDLTLTRISSRVSVVHNVRAAAPKVQAVLARLNRFAIGSAYVYDPEAGVVSSVLGGMVHEETMHFRPKQIMDFMASQLAQCESECDWLASELEGDVAVSSHSVSGSRSQPDDILNVLDGIFGADDGRPSLFENRFEFETIAEIARAVPNVATLGGSGEGIALEVPFGNGTSLGRLLGNYLHPRLGKGLGVMLLLDAYPEPEIARLAHMLNTREAAGEHPHQSFGAWGARRHSARTDVQFLGHSWFMPNRMYRSGFTLDAAYGVFGRARWANRLLNPGTPDSDAWRIMGERTRQFFKDEQSK